MTCRVWNARENQRFSCLEKVSEDFSHGRIDMPPEGVAHALE
jgi:hypothetical protein